MPKTVRVLLAGGGSGGHIIPNFAVAFALKKEVEARGFSLQLDYIGSKKPLDHELVERQGIPFYPIFAGKFRRYFSWRNFVDPVLVALGFFQSLVLMLRLWPHVVFLKGGYVCVPVALAAFVLRRPIVLHESDSRMGLANRLAARFATKVCVAFPNLTKKNPHFLFTGNPVRKGVTEGNQETGYRLTGFSKGFPVALVYGGSQGAEEINTMIQSEFASFVSNFQVIHITGAGKGVKLQHRHYRAFEYLGDELPHIYAITDFIVSRGGANSLSEIALLGKPSVLVPLPNSDQQKNAAYFGDHGAALVLKKGERLVDVLIGLSKDDHKQYKMRKTLATLSKPDAAEEIAKLILQFS